MLNGLRFPWMGTILIFLKPSLSNLLFTGPGRGLASCLAIGCLYSLNGGWPGFALSKLMQLKVLIYPKFSNKVFSIVLSKLLWGCSSDYNGGLSIV